MNEDWTSTDDLYGNEPGSGRVIGTPAPQEEEEEPDVPESPVKGVEHPATDEEYISFYPVDVTRASGTSRDVMELGEFDFMPGMDFNGGRLMVDSDEYPLHIGDKPVTWWEDDSIVPQHPVVLINPIGFGNVDAEEWMFADAFRFNKGEHFVLCDSGGFQITSSAEAEKVDSFEEHDLKDKRIYPPALVDWQVRNADAGPIMDHPPNLMKDTKIPTNKDIDYDEWVETIFEPRLEESADNAQVMSNRLKELREDDVPGAEDFRQLLVIHGQPGDGTGWEQWRHLQDWHETLDDVMHTYGGYALSPQPPNSLGQMAFHMAYVTAMDPDIDYVHVLQCGGITQFPLLAYFAMATDTYVTSDSVGYTRGHMYRQFSLPRSGLDSIRITNRKDVNVDRFPCRCPVCTEAKNDPQIDLTGEDSGSVDSLAMSLHNLHVSFEDSEIISALLHQYGVDVVDDLDVSGTSYTIENDNEFWKYMTAQIQDDMVVKLHAAMCLLRDATRHGKGGAGRWHFDRSVTNLDKEPTLQVESNGLSSEW